MRGTRHTAAGTTSKPPTAPFGSGLSSPFPTGHQTNTRRIPIPHTLHLPLHSRAPSKNAGRTTSSPRERETYKDLSLPLIYLRLLTGESCCVLCLMMASTTSSTAVAGALFSAVASSKPRGSAAFPRVAAGRRRGSCVVRCDAGVEVQAQAEAKAASIAALEQFKISADREFPRL